MSPTLDIASQRLRNQHLSDPSSKRPADVVRWQAAVQSQDYAGGKWALGLRSHVFKDPDVERAFTSGEILRTHVLRPTWHFVSPDDIRWLLMLTGPRVHAANAYYYRQLGLEKRLLARTADVIQTALEGGNHLTRVELAGRLKQSGIRPSANNNLLRTTYIIMHAELEALICSGPRRGKQFTYALIDERVPPMKKMDLDEALAELTGRYFASRGPATLNDFSWWSGLTIADARRGVEMVKPRLKQELLDGRTYWFAKSAPASRVVAPTAHLLPNYDEYFIGYKDRSALAGALSAEELQERGSELIANIVILDGWVVGGWRRTLRKDAVLVKLNLLTKLSRSGERAVDQAAKRYAEFLGLPVVLA